MRITYVCLLLLSQDDEATFDGISKWISDKTVRWNQCLIRKQLQAWQNVSKPEIKILALKILGRVSPKILTDFVKQLTPYKLIMYKIFGVSYP